MNKFLKLAAIVGAVSVLSACTPDAGTPASEWQWLNDQTMRADLFNKCLNALPAGPVSTQYNDWSEVVDSCEDSANRQSKRLAKAGKDGRWYYQDGKLVN